MPPIIVQPAKVAVQIEVPKKDNDLFQPSTYASALPGVLVAIAGFYVVHALARRRDREKRLIDTSQLVHELAGEAAAAAAEAWTATKGPKRSLAVNEARQQFQMLGLAVTRVQGVAAKIARRRSIGDCWTSRSLKGLLARHTIELKEELKNFRTTALKDPFGDPNRGPDQGVVADIHIELGNFSHALDKAVNRCLP